MTNTLHQTRLDWLLAILDRLSADDWGRVEDYYPDAAEAEAKRSAFDADAQEWESTFSAAYKALPALADKPIDLSPLADAIELASSIEGRWGDDPTTQEICREIARALDWEIKSPNDLPKMLRSGGA